MQSRSLSWARPLYFIFYAAMAALSPFLVIYYQDLGLNGTQIGVLAGLPALIGLLSGSVWSFFSDWTKKKKPILLAAFAGAILLALAISGFRTFVLLVPVVMFYVFFSAPIAPLVDSTVMTELGGEKHKYGQLRMWGAIGWGIAAPLTGWLIESYGIKTSFWTYAVLMLIGLLIAMRIPVSGDLGSTSTGELRRFLTDRRWLIFLGFTVTAGMVLSIVYNFLFLYLRELGADELTLGWMLTMATLSEVPVLFFSNRLLKRWSPLRLMTASIFLLAIRAIAYTLIGAPWMALIVQLLHGPTFSMMWTAGVSYADSIAPPGLHATAQGVFSGAMWGVGSAVGALLGGVVYQQAGLVNLFRLGALIALICGGFMLYLESRKHEKSI